MIISTARVRVTGFVIGCVVASGGCREKQRDKDVPKGTPAPKSGVVRSDPTPTQDVDADEPVPSFPTPSPDAIAKVDAAARIALDMCRKELDDVVRGDARTYETFVAALLIPPTGDVGGSGDEMVAWQDGYLASGTFPFVATGAAIHIWSDDSFGVMVVGDGSDPCKAVDVAYLTENGTPALKLTLLNRPGDQATSEDGFVRGPTGIQKGAGFFRIEDLQKGKGVKVSVHVCFDQEPELQFWSIGKPLPVRYFAIGTIEAGWCPYAEP